jgi:hypothetical protein
MDNFVTAFGMGNEIGPYVRHDDHPTTYMRLEMAVTKETHLARDFCQALRHDCVINQKTHLREKASCCRAIILYQDFLQGKFVECRHFTGALPISSIVLLGMTLQ